MLRVGNAVVLYLQSSVSIGRFYAKRQLTLYSQHACRHFDVPSLFARDIEGLETFVKTWCGSEPGRQHTKVTSVHGIFSWVKCREAYSHNLPDRFSASEESVSTNHTGRYYKRHCHGIPDTDQESFFHRPLADRSS